MNIIGSYYNTKSKSVWTTDGFCYDEDVFNKMGEGRKTTGLVGEIVHIHNFEKGG